MPDYLSDAHATTEKLRTAGGFALTSAPTVAYTAIADQLQLANILAVLTNAQDVLRLTGAQGDQLVSQARVLLGFTP